MKWRGRRQSTNVEDRRGQGARPKMAMGGGLGILIIVILVALMGGDPMALLEQMGTSQAPTQSTGTVLTPEQNELARFVSVVLADTEDVWHEQFRRMGKQ
jgi:predicted metalloprotease